jgi:DNA repair protein RecO (recombination protein O)
MLEKQEGIVLKQIKYSDSGRILSIFTKEKGKRSYFLHQSSKKKAGRSAVVAQPFSLVELLVNESRVEGKMGRIKEIRIATPTLGIRENFAKTSLALFLNEVVNHCVQEEEENKGLFSFLKSSILALNHEEASIGNFHLGFLVGLATHLGIQPEVPADDRPMYFDMMEGHFTPLRPAHNMQLDLPCSAALLGLIKGITPGSLVVSSSQRKTLLDQLLCYYELHLPNFGPIRSHQVLATVWQEV